MKAATLTLTLLAATLTLGQAASAQQFSFGPFSVDLGQLEQSSGGGYRPHVRQPGWADYEQSRPRIDNRRPQPYRPNPYDNSVYVQPDRLERLVYNPSTGQWQVKIGREDVRESALDPHRGTVDPGSYRVTSSQSFDGNGNLVETRVESWTSYGRPHSNTSRRVIRRSGNGLIEDETRILQSTGPNSRD